MRTRLVYSTTRLDQETTRHFAVITDANTLHNRAAEWKMEEILSSCVWKASDILRLCSVMLSQPVLSSHWVKTCHPHTSHLIEILITTSNRFGPSEKKEKLIQAEGKERKSLFRAHSVLRMYDVSAACLQEGFRGRLTEEAHSNPSKKAQMHPDVQFNWSNPVCIFNLLSSSD